MGKETGISWADHTFNPWWGCVKVSPACDDCYAETWDHRLFPIHGQGHWGKDAPRRFFKDEHWQDLHKWNRAAEKAGKRRNVFVGSMCDIMEDRPDLHQFRQGTYGAMKNTPWLNYLFLTKRPQNYSKLLPEEWLVNPLPNLWLGTTVESPAYTWRADELRKLPAAVRWLSIEPLLGQFSDEDWANLLRDIDWGILGGESGKNARSGHMLSYSDGLRAMLRFNVSPFMKQLGANAIDTNGLPYKTVDKSGADPSEWPSPYRLQRFPTPRQFPGDAA